MSDTSKGSTMDTQCDKSIPTALDHENDSHVDDTPKQRPITASHENLNLITRRRSERIRQQLAQESENVRKERLQKDAGRHRLRRLQESEQETQ
ncbi:unnamed protein product [Rotaria sp. Silwood1]|nr:unnamed protein product [Rotaria sp. Silwood1]CAF5129687.1 unnamed protein product [Rotaria sp. Silwood1]